MSTDALFSNYSVNSEVCYVNETQEIPKTGSLTARAVIWFKGKDDSDAVRMWKTIGAVALAILLAASLVGIPFLIEGIYLWQKHTVSRVLDIAEDSLEKDYVQPELQQAVFNTQQSISEVTPKLSLSTKETSSEEDDLYHLEDDELYSVKQEKFPNSENMNLISKKLSFDTSSETSEEMENSDDDTSINKEKNLSELADKCAKLFAAETHDPVAHKFNKPADETNIKPKGKIVFDLSMTGTTFSDDDLYGPMDDDDLYGVEPSEKDVYLVGETHLPSETGLNSPTMLSTGWKAHSVGLGILKQNHSTIFIEGHETYTVPEYECGKLSELPELPPLNHLNLSGCEKLSELPKEIKDLQSLSSNGESINQISSFNYKMPKELLESLKNKPSDINYSMSLPVISHWEGKKVTLSSTPTHKTTAIANKKTVDMLKHLNILGSTNNLNMDFIASMMEPQDTWSTGVTNWDVD